jgi:hypothetical protein
MIIAYICTIFYLLIIIKDYANEKTSIIDVASVSDRHCGTSGKQTMGLHTVECHDNR